MVYRLWLKYELDRQPEIVLEWTHFFRIRSNEQIDWVDSLDITPSYVLLSDNMNSVTRKSGPFNVDHNINSNVLPLSLYSWRLFHSVPSQLLMTRHIPVLCLTMYLPTATASCQTQSHQQNQAVVVSSSVCGSIQKVSVSFYSQLDFRWLRVQNIVITYIHFVATKRFSAQVKSICLSSSRCEVDVSEGGCKRYKIIMWKVRTPRKFGDWGMLVSQ